MPLWKGRVLMESQQKSNKAESIIRKMIYKNNKIYGVIIIPYNNWSPSIKLIVGHVYSKDYFHPIFRGDFTYHQQTQTLKQFIIEKIEEFEKHDKMFKQITEVEKWDGKISNKFDIDERLKEGRY